MKHGSIALKILEFPDDALDHVLNPVVQSDVVSVDLLDKDMKYTVQQVQRLIEFDGEPDLSFAQIMERMPLSPMLDQQGWW